MFNKNEMFFVLDAFKVIFCQYFTVKDNLDSGADPNGPLKSGRVQCFHERIKLKFNLFLFCDSMITCWLLYFYFD